MAVRGPARCSSTRVPDTLLPALGCWVTSPAGSTKQHAAKDWRRPCAAEACVLQQQQQEASTSCKSNLTTRLQRSKQPHPNRQAAINRTAHSTDDARTVALQKCAHSSQPTIAARSFSVRIVVTALVHMKGSPAHSFERPKAFTCPAQQ